MILVAVVGLGVNVYGADPQLKTGDDCLVKDEYGNAKPGQYHGSDSPVHQEVELPSSSRTSGSYSVGGNASVNVTPAAGIVGGSAGVNGSYNSSQTTNSTSGGGSNSYNRTGVCVSDDGKTVGRPAKMSPDSSNW